MQDLSVLKEDRRPGTPLFLFECQCSDAQVFYWCSHAVTVDGHSYESRVIDHSPLEYRTVTGDETAFVPRASVRLANSDQALSSLTAEQLWKGAQLTIRFVLYDLVADEQSCDSVVMLKGSINAPDEVDYKTMRLSAVNRIGAHRSHLPALRLQRRCSWQFPRNPEERTSAASESSRYSPFYGCGYSPDISGGRGNSHDSGIYTTCNYTKSDCGNRGMYDTDVLGAITRRFSGFQYVPVSTLVRGYGEKSFSLSAPSVTDISGTQVIPIAYGTVWTDGIISVARSDGNLHHLEAVLCSGPIATVVKVLVQGIEIPRGLPQTDMTATGWYNVVSYGNRTGAFNLDFVDDTGTPVGDPNGSIAVVSVVVPSAVIGRRTSIEVQVLIQGSILPTYDQDGAFLGDAYSSNPAWVLLDVLRRSGYREEELEISSFGRAAIACDAPISAVDTEGLTMTVARSECNVLLRSRRPVAELLRGIQLGSGLSLRFNKDGKLEAFVEAALADQHSTAPAGSNATLPLNGGWPAYEFGDGSDGSYGILLTGRGEPTLRLFSRSHAESSNQVTVEFLNPNSDYAIDTYSLADLDDVLRVGQEISSRVPAVGVTGHVQAQHVCRRILAKSLRGNLYAEFETSIKAICLRPGDIITIHVPSAGMLRKPFRVLSIAPRFNGERLKLVAQVHDDRWYNETTDVPTSPDRRPASEMTGEPRPLLGDDVDSEGNPQYSVAETSIESSDGSQRVRVAAGFVVPDTTVVSPGSVPTVSLIPEVLSTGGILEGAQNYYYAITYTDASNHESALSSTVHGFVPSGWATASIGLRNIRIPADGTHLNVYRGPDPWQIRRIASSVSPTGTFDDPGLPSLPIGPPDPNFAKARFEWRSEYLPPVPVSHSDETHTTVSGIPLVPGSLASKVLRIHSGTGFNQERLIVDNSTNSITIATKWTPAPDTTSTVCVTESNWIPGGEAATSPAAFEVPNQAGSTIHLRGYAVNASGLQSRKDLAAILRHTIEGALGPNQDLDVPSAPTYSLSAENFGLVSIGAIGFTTLDNTSTINAGTLQLHYLSELDLQPLTTLGSSILAADDTIVASTIVTIEPGTLMRIGNELIRVVDSTPDATDFTVERGTYGTAALAHPAGTEIFPLARHTSILPVPRHFFGSPASGDFSFSIPFSNNRIVASDLQFTNSKGHSEATSLNFCSLEDGGLRILTGGQISIQIGGYLGIQTAAAPPIVVDGDHAVRDIFAVVTEPPTGAPLLLRLRHDDEELCTLVIAPGSLQSNIIAGTDVAPLLGMERVTLDVVSVGQGSGTTPGRDLTVTIRL